MNKLSKKQQGFHYDTGNRKGEIHFNYRRRISGFPPSVSFLILIVGTVVVSYLVYSFTACLTMQISNK